MAKHQKGKQVSKGVRRSSINAGKPVKRQAIVVERVRSAMSEAMCNIKIASHITESKVVDAVMVGIKQHTGNPKAGRGWTANLSPRTVKALTEAGVFA
jgi:hypothetical protein